LKKEKENRNDPRYLNSDAVMTVLQVAELPDVDISPS
jgi:hypothetical protein